MTLLAPTPFHARTAEHNLANAWVRRGAFSVPAHYGDAHQEALAARVSAVLADITPREDLHVEGAGAAAMLSAASGTSAETMELGASRSVHWCADGGGVRGIGQLYRLAETEFLLRSDDADLAWFAPASPRFGASVRDTTKERGVLLLAGPYAFAVLAAAGLEEAVHLENGLHRIFAWRGIDIAVSRQGPCAAYQIACGPDDATIIFDRLWRAGRMFGLRLAGQEAFELLQLEAGELIQGRDFQPARDGLAREPSLASLGLTEAMRAHNGATRWKLAGVEFDTEVPMPFAALFRDGAEAGRTLRSAYSPALRRAIALAVVKSDCDAGTVVSARRNGGDEVPARAVTLPFLP